MELGDIDNFYARMVVAVTGMIKSPKRRLMLMFSDSER